MVGALRIELRLYAPKAHVLPLYDAPQTLSQYYIISLKSQLSVYAKQKFLSKPRKRKKKREE